MDRLDAKEGKGKGAQRKMNVRSCMAIGKQSTREACPGLKKRALALALSGDLQNI
jgi:hypothetical protein